MVRLRLQQRQPGKRQRRSSRQPERKSRHCNAKRQQAKREQPKRKQAKRQQAKLARASLCQCTPRMVRLRLQQSQPGKCQRRSSRQPERQSKCRGSCIHSRRILCRRRLLRCRGSCIVTP